MPKSVEARDEDLLRRIATGNEEAFRQFYARHQAGIYRFAVHMTGRPDAAEEAVQETFMTLIREAEKFDAKLGAPQAFLYGIARNHARRLMERERRYEPFLNGNGSDESANEAEQVPSADEHLLDGMARTEIVEQVRSALEQVPAHYREAVILCDLEEHDYATAAAILQCPIGTVRSRLARGREMLAAKLRRIPAAKKLASGRN